MPLQEITKASPPVAIGALTFAGLSLSDWVLVTSILYAVMQMFFLLRDKWWRERKPAKECIIIIDE
jgi:hypothetical protein